MTWRERIVVRILLVVAKIINDDELVATELKNLAVTISVDGAKAEPRTSLVEAAVGYHE